MYTILHLKCYNFTIFTTTDGSVEEHLRDSNPSSSPSVTWYELGTNTARMADLTVGPVDPSKEYVT